MPKFKVYCTLEGSKYVGTFEAKTKEEAIDIAEREIKAKKDKFDDELISELVKELWPEVD